MKKIAWMVGLTIIMAILLVGCAEQGKTSAETVVKETAKPSEWETSFAEAGFSDDEIENYREVFNTIGVTDFHDVSIVDNSPMTIIRGKIYDSNNLQLNVTLENRQIIYIGLAGIPDTKAEAYLNWRGKVKWKTVDTKRTVDMYSDTEGGYLAVLDWENKTISEYEG